MAVYKDNKRGTWYVSLYYKDASGKRVHKKKHLAAASGKTDVGSLSVFDGEIINRAHVDNLLIPFIFVVYF